MITVRQLVEDESLGLTLVAGASGDFRLITWAHAVDLPDPWRWITEGNLVMTTGGGLPSLPAEQVSWIERLEKSNASGLVIAPQKGAPELSTASLEAANRLSFPIITASFELEFVRISHHLFEIALQSQKERFKASEQLFKTYADALRSSPDMPARLAVLARQLHLNLEIEDRASGKTLFSSLQGENTEPALPHFVERIPIAGRARANLVMWRKDSMAVQDVLMIRSLVGLLGIELERMMIHRDTQREEGAGLLRNLLEEGTEFSFIRPILERRGLHGSLVCFAIKAAPGGRWSSAEIHHAPGLHSLTPLFLEEGDVLLGLAPDNNAILCAMIENLGPHTLVGVSGPITAAAGFSEAVRQARLALAQAKECNTPLRRYGENAELGLVLTPRTLAEARALVGRYLGPILDYDRTNHASLLDTLSTFLENDRNWKSTAFDLGIHRQTLVHRLKLIEQLTSLKPTSTSGTAKFWLALQAAQTLA